MANESMENSNQSIERPPEDDPGPRMESDENAQLAHSEEKPDEGDQAETKTEDKSGEDVDTNMSWTKEVELSMDNSSYNNSITSTDSRSALLNGETGTDVTVKEKPTILDIPYIQVVYEYNDFQDLANVDQYRSRSNTMMGLLESPAYIDSVNCPTPDRRRLARACRNAVLTLSQDIVQKKTMGYVPNDPDKYDDATPNDKDEDDPGDFNSINHHMNNLVFLGITVFLMATAILSLKNLQSSLNHNDNVGLYSLAAGYCSFTVFSLFTPFIVQRFRPKRCLIIGLLPQVLYVAANLYPTFQVLVIMAFFQGIGNAILWNAISTYVTYLARSYALKNDDRTVHVASRYFGIIFFFYQFSMVVGNLISSVVLMLGRTQDTLPTHNRTATVFTHTSFNHSYRPMTDINHSSQAVSPGFCGSKYCHSDNFALPNMTVNNETKYTLLGIFGLCVAFSVVVPMYLLSSLKPYRTTYANCSVICKQFTSVLRCTFDRRFLMLFLAFMYSTVQNSFVTGDVTKAFVTCSMGIHMVGYAMICFGVCAGLSSYLSGYVNKHVGHVWLLTAVPTTST
ncbi:protein unc-93 homolog A-like isoform X2 [Mizuhopecten yessoensis]|uniref:protein unc-93 homolog A-like isoform X2 n=1 Tax=Mizuhopecten yessoensis TaxID=6573 RepID=UPI000B458BE0|nr:protein unc-93 homolog A-like isoform X2 [Mizuhopecten yessoensis]